MSKCDVCGDEVAFPNDGTLSKCRHIIRLESGETRKSWQPSPAVPQAQTETHEVPPELPEVVPASVLKCANETARRRGERVRELDTQLSAALSEIKNLRDENALRTKDVADLNGELERHATDRVNQRKEITKTRTALARAEATIAELVTALKSWKEYEDAPSSFSWTDIEEMTTKAITRATG